MTQLCRPQANPELKGSGLTALTEGHLRDGCDGLFAELHLFIQCDLLAEAADCVVNCCLQPLRGNQSPQGLQRRAPTS